MEHFFTRLIFSILFCAFNFYASLAQPTDCVPNSGSDATIIFGQGVVPTLNGNPLPTGAYIVAVFNSSGGLKCAGFNQWQNIPMSISPKGANTGFEGYASGETYKFRIILPGGDVIQNDKITVAFKSPDGILCLNGNAFVADGISCIQSFSAINNAPILTVTPVNLNVSASAGSSTVSVTSNINWSASSNASWLTLTPASGTNNGTLTVNYQANTSIQSRTATITVSGSGVSSQTVNVTQAGTSPSQPFTTLWNIPSGASTLSFYIQTVGTTSYSWTAGSQSGSGTWGTTNGQVTINVSATANNTPLTLSISPDNLRRFYMFDDISESPSAEKLINVTNWGTVKWSSMRYMFFGCKNLNITGSPAPPNLDNVTSMSCMFCNCETLNGPSNIGNWNVSNVVYMSSMFDFAKAFNQPIGNWNVSNVIDMNSMFVEAKAFNQPISNWNVSNVTAMFQMFAGASKFNQPIGNWNVSKVTDMSIMFDGTSSFNQPIGNWNVSKVTNMYRMFSNNSVFNQPIGNWNVSNVTDMSWMFQGASKFNQPLNNWNVSKVTDMTHMFDGTSSFNQQIGNWKLNPNVILANIDENFGFLQGSGMNCDNYSATLIGWQQNNPNVKGRLLIAHGLKYGINAVAARNALINTHGWTILSDMPSGTLCGISSTEDKNEENVFNIYPNPTTGIISIESDFKEVKNIEIRSMDGKLIQMISELRDHTIDLSNLAPGSYILRGLVNNNPFARKVVILR